MRAPAELAANYLADFNSYLDSHLQDSEIPAELIEAVRYSALAEGKRIRPLLVYATGLIFNAPQETLLSASMAVECIHCYSLIHDDLPAMDDDDMRRGRPTLHKQYDEAMAILAGDALQTMAFEALSGTPDAWPSPLHALKAINTLARASGPAGMVGGQVLDIRAEGTYPSQAEVEHMFLLKTGVLIRASTLLGLYASTGTSQHDETAITCFGTAIGQAFQIQDDVLDVTTSSEVLGKPQGSDEAKDKPNYALRFGLDNARIRAKSLFEEAISHLAHYDERAALLRWLAELIIQRVK